jgi:hypothetical protein
MKAATYAGITGGILGAGGALAAYQLALRPWHLRWGATDEEIARAMPGDAAVENPTLVSTRAVTIRARPEDIWPWLVQIGKGRAGFYSYDWIENLMGLGIKSVDRILPEFQDLAAGDELSGLGPVTALERNRYLLLAGHEPWGDVSWILALYPLDDATTRLISRTRYRLRWGVIFRLLPPRMLPFYALFEPGEFLMLRKMLLGVKRRAERIGTAKRPAEVPGTAVAPTGKAASASG